MSRSHKRTRRALPGGVFLIALGLLSPGVPAQELAPLAALEAKLAEDRYDEVVAGAYARLQESPAEYASLRLMSLALLAKGEWNLARDALSSTVAARPEGELGLDLLARLMHLELAQGSHADAVTRARSILETFQSAPISPSAGDHLGAAQAATVLARHDSTLFESALNILEAGLAKYPGAVELHVGVGELLLSKYNGEEARAAFVDALKQDEDSLVALLALAKVEIFEDSPDALKLAREVVTRRPRWPQAQLVYARALLHDHDLNAALAAIDQALELNPHSAQAWALHAAHSMLIADDAGMDVALEKSIASAPGDASSMLLLAELAVRNRLYPYAAQFAQRAITVDDQSWRAHGLLGLNQLRVGADRSARLSLERSFRGDPYNIWVKNTLDLLDKMEGFETLRSPHFELVAPPQEAAVLANYLLPLAEQAFEHFAKRYGDEPPTPIRIEVFDKHQDFSVRTIGLVGVDILGASFGPVIAMDSPSTRTFGTINWASVIWHEVSHSFHLSLSRYRVPRWFTEGLAVLEEHQARPGWGGDVSMSFLNAFRLGELPRATELEASFQKPATSEQVGHLYYLSYLLMEFIDRQYGAQAIVRILHGFAEGRSAAELVGSATGLYGEGLNGALERHIELRFGHSVKSLQPIAESDAVSTDRSSTASAYELMFKTGMAAAVDGDKFEAISAFEQAVRLFPEHAGQGSAYHQLAKLYRELDDKLRLRKVLEKITAINADDLEAQAELTNLTIANDPPEAAMAALEKLNLIDPYDANMHARLAALLEERGDWKRAAQERYSVLQLDPADKAGAHYHLARALARMGDARTAHAHILSALEIAPMFEDGLELLLDVRDTLTAEGDN